MNEKAAIRHLAAEKAAAITDRAGKAACMTETIIRLPQFRRAESIFCFVSSALEPDTRELISLSHRYGKRVFVPRCRDGEGNMEAVEIFPDTALTPGRFGIAEPPGDLPGAETDSFDFMAVPCVACSEDMTRLGHGGGYYDRFFARCRGFKAALCFEELIFSKLPREEFDIDPDMIITECRVIAAERNA